MRRLAAPAATVLVALSVVTHAWDKDGHEAIGMTAMSALEPVPTAQVKRLMGGRDAVDVAAWAHKVNKKYKWTVDLHFQKQAVMPVKGADLSNCKGNICLVRALEHFYGRLVHKPSYKVEWPEDIKLTDADCVKYLINLVGDLHQPMHLGVERDDMGRNFPVEFRGKRTNLFDIWDKEISKAVIHDSPSFWWGGWTHVQRTRVEYDQDGVRWKEEGVKMLETWANESAKYLAEHIYRNPITGKDITTEVQGGVFQMGEDLYEVWKRDMLGKMLVAGARVAIILNAILQHREGQENDFNPEELHAGSSVQGVEEEETPTNKAGRSADLQYMGKQSVKGAKAFGINAGLFLLEVVIFLQVMRYWRGTEGVERAMREKAVGGEGGKKT